MKYKVIFLLIIVIMFNGIINSRELNELAIVSAMGIELNENGEYVLTAQILNPKKSGNSSSGGGSSADGAIVTVYTNSSESVQNAVRYMIKESPQRLYLAHMELLILSDELASSKEITDTLDFFIRDNEGSSNFTLAISKDCNPSDVLKTLTPLETVPTENIINSIGAARKYQGISVDKLLMEQLEILLCDGKEMVVTSISLDGEEDGLQKEEDLATTNVDTKIVIDDLAYFKGNKLKGYIEGDDNIMYNLLTNNLQNSVINIGEEKDRIAAEIINSGCKMKPKRENGEYIIDIDINVECNVTELGENLSTKDNLEKITKDINNEIKSKVSKFIYNTQNVYESDVIGLENVFYKHLNKEYKLIQNDFNEKYFQKIKTNVNVSTKLPDEGGMVKQW